MKLRGIALAVLVAAGCKGNVNDDTVATILIQIASVSTGGQTANNGGRRPDVNYDGTVVVFESNASNLDPRDTNTINDIYVRFVSENRTELVTVNVAGTGSGNNFSDNARVSPDGQYVVFNSQSTNLSAFTDNNGQGTDVFCRDLYNGITIPVSLNAARTGTHPNSTFQPADVVADGTNVYVTYVQSTNAANEIIVGVTGQQVYVRRIPIATFATIATHDVFLVSDDLAAGVTEGNNSSENPVIGQDDGGPNLYIAFESNSTNLIPALDSTSTTDVYWVPMVKATGALGVLQLVSINDGGTSGGTDGQAVPTPQTSDRPSISDDGGWVAFQSDASDLLPIGDDNNGVQDIYVRGDLILGPLDTFRASITSAGNETTSESLNPSISDGGAFLVYESGDPNIVPGDTNGFNDIFRADLTTGAVDRASLTLFGGEPNANCGSGSSFESGSAISGNGSHVVFQSGASNIIPGSFFDTQVYLRGL